MGSTLADLDKTLDDTPPAELREREYRRGYCDGWVQAIQALDRLLGRGLSRSVAYSKVYDHWYGALAEWRKQDIGEVEYPPVVKV